MPGIQKDNSTKKEVFSNITVSSKKDYSKDPFVVKKIESSKKIVEKYGFPKELITG